ncbi:Transposable element Tc1 transposase, partial [Stegodyphus mimosarum]
MPGCRQRRHFQQMDDFTRGMVIGLRRAGWSLRQIAADTHTDASTVHRLWRTWLEQGNVGRSRAAGAARVTSARVDRRIRRQAVVVPQVTCTAILQHVQDNLDVPVSTRAISRRLVERGLHSWRPLRRLPLTPQHRRQRLEWCRTGAMSPLVRIQGTMTAQRHLDNVLWPVEMPYLQGLPNAIFQQHNVRPHSARICQHAVQGIQMLPWPPHSPDLSPIEHMWDVIGRRLQTLPLPRSEGELGQWLKRNLEPSLRTLSALLLTLCLDVFLRASLSAVVLVTYVNAVL